MHVISILFVLTISNCHHTPTMNRRRKFQYLLVLFFVIMINVTFFSCHILVYLRFLLQSLIVWCHKIIDVSQSYHELPLIFTQKYMNIRGLQSLSLLHCNYFRVFELKCQELLSQFTHIWFCVLDYFFWIFCLLLLLLQRFVSSNNIVCRFFIII